MGVCVCQGELFRKLVYLEYLSENFENDVWYIQHTTTMLGAVIESFPQTRTRAVMVHTEVS